VASACLADEPAIADAFRTGEGVGWHEHDERLFEGTERLFRPAYRGSLIEARIPALDGVQAKLEAARQAGVSERVRFEVAGAGDFPAGSYDLICFFDCLHDMGDPVGACEHALRTLAEDGTIMVVEPHAGDRVEDNLNPVGRMFYCASTLLCTPNAIDQDGGYALGAQAGEARLAEIARRAGLTRFRRAAETPLNLVLEARR
jgi:SAM-dependent methyltransferase